MSKFEKSQVRPKSRKYSSHKGESVQVYNALKFELPSESSVVSQMITQSPTGIFPNSTDYGFE